MGLGRKSLSGLWIRPVTPGMGTARPIAHSAVAWSMNGWSTSVMSSRPSMNVRTEVMMVGSSVMMTASSAKVELRVAFAEPMTAVRGDHFRVQGRGGEDSDTSAEVVGGGGGVRSDGGCAGVDDEDVSGSQRK